MISLLIILREKLIWRDIQTQFMRERSHSNMKFVPVAVTAVKWESKVRTGSWTTGSSPPRGVFTSSPQKSSPIWVNFVLMQPKDGDMKSSPRDPVPENKCRYFILENLKQVLYVHFTVHQAAVHTLKENKNSKENILLVKLWKNLRNKPRMVMEFTKKVLKYLIYISEVLQMSKYQLPRFYPKI